MKLLKLLPLIITTSILLSLTGCALTGEPGKDGAEAPSACELAVKYGFEGTDIATYLARFTGATVYNCSFDGCRMTSYVPKSWDAFSMYRRGDLDRHFVNKILHLQQEAYPKT